MGWVRKYTPAELEAYALIGNKNTTTSATGKDMVEESANKIILLAEKIKAERATMSKY